MLEIWVISDLQPMNFNVIAKSKMKGSYLHFEIPDYSWWIEHGGGVAIYNNFRLGWMTV